MIGSEKYFSEGYPEARKKFLAACQEAGREVTSHVHTLTGPDGGELAIDHCYFGATKPTKLLVVTSGVHGPELMTGSGPQVGMLLENRFDDLPADMGVLMIHGANPWGSAYIRRNNEDNVDLCRNFVDFNSPPERNTNYDDVKDWLPYAFAKGKLGDDARAKIEKYKSEKGPAAFGRGFMAGQYHDAVGMSFGGFEPVWSNRILESILSPYAAFAKKVICIDFHSGLGPYAYCTAVCLQTGPALARARNVFGKWILAPNDPETVGDGKAPDVSGHTTELHERIFAGANVVSVVLEYGVETYDTTAEIMMREHRLTHGTEADPERLKETRQKLLRVFYPQDKYWRRAIWDHSQIAIDQAMEDLNS